MQIYARSYLIDKELRRKQQLAIKKREIILQALDIPQTREPKSDIELIVSTDYTQGEDNGQPKYLHKFTFQVILLIE